MRGHIKRRLQGMLAVLLSAAMVVTCVPATAFTVYAEEAKESVQEPGVPTPAEESVSDDTTSETAGGGYGGDAVKEEPAAEEAPAAEETPAAEDGGTDGQKPAAEDGVTADDQTSGEETAAGGQADGTAGTVNDEQTTTEEAPVKEEKEELTPEIVENNTVLNNDLPVAVLFGFNNDEIESYDDYTHHGEPGYESYNPWEYNGSLIGGDYKDYMFTGGEGREGEPTPVYFGIQTDKIPAGGTVKLEEGSEGWITGCGTITPLREMDFDGEFKGAAQTGTYSYFKAELTIDGKLSEKNPTDKKQTLIVKTDASGIETEVATFTLQECWFEAQYRIYDKKSGWGTWETAEDGKRVALSVGDRIQVNFNADPKRTTGLIGQVDEIDETLLEVKDISAEAKTALATHDYRVYGADGCYDIFTYNGDNETNYPEMEVKSKAGVGRINLGVLDSEGCWLFGGGIEYTNLPVYQLRQVLPGGASGEPLMQKNDSDPESTVNPLYVPEGNVFRFYLCDAEGEPLTDGGYALDDWRYREVSIGWDGDYRRVDDNCIRLTEEDGKTILEIDANGMEIPSFKDNIWFNMFLELGIKKTGLPDGQYQSWDFRHDLSHEAGDDLIVFGVGEYCGQDGSGKYELWNLEGRVWDGRADYDGNLYFNTCYLEPDHEGGSVMTVPVYARIPKENASKGKVTAAVAAGNKWIQGTPTVDDLGEFEVTIQEADPLNNVEEIKKTYCYYRINLPIRTWPEDGSEINSFEEFVGKFTVTGGGASDTFTLLETRMEYQVSSDSGSNWSEWQPCEDITLNKGDQISFRITGNGMGQGQNPYGSVRVVKDSCKEGERDWLLGYGENGTPVNESLFDAPAIDKRLGDYLKDFENGLGCSYGGWGDYQMFHYPTKDNPGDDDWQQWNPVFTVSGSAPDATNWIDVTLINRFGQGVIGNRMEVTVNSSQYVFQDGGTSTELVNWSGKERPQGYNMDAISPVSERKLIFKLYDKDNNNAAVTMDTSIDGIQYELGEGSSFQMSWRQTEYEGFYDPWDPNNSDMFLQADGSGEVYLEINLDRLYNQYGHLGPDAALDPAERYDLYLNFRVYRVNVTDVGTDDEYRERMLRWDYEYDLTHEETEAEILLFGLGRQDNFADLQGAFEDSGSEFKKWYDKAVSDGKIASNALTTSSWNADGVLDDDKTGIAWQYLLDFGWVDKASRSGIIAASTTMLNDYTVPVYVRIPTSSAWDRNDAGSIFAADGLSLSWDDGSAWLGTYGDYTYYRVRMENYNREINAGSRHQIRIVLNDGDPGNGKENTEKTFTLAGMVVCYQIGDSKEWKEYRYGDRFVTLKKGDKIRFKLEGSVLGGNPIGNVNSINADVFEVTEPDDTVKGYLKKFLDRDEYIESWDDNGQNYYNCCIFNYPYKGIDADYNWRHCITYGPELTVISDTVPVSNIGFDAHDDFGERLCGDEIRFSMLPVYTLRQGDSSGKLIGNPLIQETDAVTEDYRNPISIPADGKVRFYLCDENGDIVKNVAGAYNIYGSVGLYPYDIDGMEVGAETVWNPDAAGCYVEINLKNLAKATKAWLPNGFDLWLNIDLEDKADKEKVWQFHYALSHEIALRQAGNTGKSFSEDLSNQEYSSDRYNLMTGDGWNVLMPDEEGKVRLYFYQLAYKENGVRDYVPVTGERPLGIEDDDIPYVWLKCGKFEVDDNVFVLNDEGTSGAKDENGTQRVTFGKDDDGPYLEINLKDIVKHDVPDGSGGKMDVSFDPYKDQYELEVQFIREDPDNALQKEFTRYYGFMYAPVTVLSWDASDNLAQELARDMTNDEGGRLTPYGKAYADATRICRADGSVVLYIRAMKGITVNKTTLSLQPTDGNPWVGDGKADNWFTEIVSVESIADLMDQYYTGGDWETYPVDKDVYEYYQVRLKGKAGNFTFGSIVLNAGGEENYEFTLEGAWAQYYNSGTGKFEDVENGTVILQPSDDMNTYATQLRLVTGGGLAENGVIAQVCDEGGSGGFYLNNDGFAGDPENAWDANYNDPNGPYDGYDNYIFTYGTNDTYYPTITSNEAVNGDQTFSLHAIQTDENDPGNWWPELACRVNFTKASYSLRYEKDLAHDLEEYEGAIDFTKDKVKFYVYKNGSKYDPYDAVGEYVKGFDCVEDYGGGIEKRITLWYGDYEMQWDLPYDADVEANTRLGRDDDKGLYIELDTAKLSAALKDNHYDIKNYPYHFELVVPIGVDGEEWFSVSASHHYMNAGNIGAKLVTRSFTGDDGKDHEVFEFLKGTGGKATVDLWQETCKLGFLNAEVGDIDFKKTEVTSSDKSVAEVESQMAYAGEDKYQSDIYRYAVLSLKKPGTAKITLKLVPKAGTETTVSFDLTVKYVPAKSLEKVTIAQDVTARNPYTGKRIMPEVVLKDGTYTLVKGVDYTLLYENDINIGTATLTITAMGDNYEGTRKRIYKIFGTLTYEYAAGVTAMPDGKELPAKPLPVEFDENGVAKLKEMDAVEGYRFAWYSDAACTTEVTSVPAGTNANPTYYGKWTPNTYTISYYDGDKEITGLTPTSYVYGVETKLPETVTKESYTFAGWYENNKLEGDAVTAIPAGTLGDKIFFAKWTKTEVTPDQPDQPDQPGTKKYTVTFNTNGGSAVASQTVEEGKTVTKPADPTREGYTFGGWYKDAALSTAWNFETDKVTSDITLYARWNAVVSDTVSPEDIPDDYYSYADSEMIDLASAGSVSNVKDKVYDGKPYLPGVTVKAAVDGKTITLTEGADYRVLYEKNINAGDGKVIVKGNGRYKGQLTVPFKITPKPMNKVKAISGSVAVGYTGQPSIKVYDEGKLLLPGVDYTASEWTADMAASKGTKTVTVTAKDGSNYTGSLSVSVKVIQPKGNSTVLTPENTEIALQYSSTVYTGGACKPTVTVKCDGTELAKKSYSVKYTNNKNAGTAFVTVSGKGGYSGSVITTFEIRQPELAFKLKNNISSKTYVFKGKLQKPKVVVTADVASKTRKLKAGKDYIVIYRNNLHANDGAAADADKSAVIIRGIGNFEGSSSEFYFTIKPQKISAAKVGGTDVNLILTYAKRVLQEGTDYEVSEYGEEKGGTVAVTIKGLGDFDGSTVTKKVKAE